MHNIPTVARASRAFVPGRAARTEGLSLLGREAGMTDQAMRDITVGVVFLALVMVAGAVMKSFGFIGWP